MPFYTIFLFLLARIALWFSTGQREFEPKEAALQEAAQFLCDYYLAMLWFRPRIVTLCFRDVDKMDLFTPS